MPPSFIVTIFAPDPQALRRLQAYDLDLFHATAAHAALLTSADAEAHDECRIDGLLSLEEIGRLVADGFQVLVKEDAAKQAHGRIETIEFEQWLKEVTEE